MNQHKKSRLTVLALVALFALPLASCGPATSPTTNPSDTKNSQNGTSQTGGEIY